MLDNSLLISLRQGRKAKGEFTLSHFGRCRTIAFSMLFQRSIDYAIRPLKGSDLSLARESTLNRLVSLSAAVEYFCFKLKGDLSEDLFPLFKFFK